MSGRYSDRVRDLLDDAGRHAAAGEWDAVRDLASAALALAPESEEARRLLRDASTEAPLTGERRQLTVMFCDMVGSTALTQDHDPEVLREVLRSYQAACDEVVRRYEGRIARFVGDGVLAYFGHPVAHEDDARRGVRAGLDLLDAIEPVTDEARRRFGIDVRVRIAVHTGLVVRAAMGSPTTPDPDAIVGETPNLAARLQELADPGTLVISAATLDLVRGWFLVAPLPPASLKGIDREIAAYRVLEEQPATSRLSARADLTPFVGRQAELDTLEAHWQEVKAGASRAVLLVGDAGVGKSRLADVVRRRVEASDGGALVTGCSSYQTTTPFYAARRLIEAAAGIDVRHDGPQALPKLWTAMDSVGQGDGLPLLADLLGLPPEPWCPSPELDGTVLRERVLATLVDWLVAVAARIPRLVLVEDVQWADPTTLELLSRLVGRKVPGLLLVLTARESFVSPWRSVEVVPVDRLSEDDLRELAGRLPEARTLDEASLDELIERSDGVPLFLEELIRTRAVTAAEAHGRTEHVPAALRDLLLARFAAPGVDLRLAQLLATIGNEAPAQLVAAVSGLPASDLDRQLERLVETGTLVRQPGGAGFRFRHHLLADLAYDTQLQGARQSAHAAVADALLAEQSVSGTLDAGALAHHLEHAGRFGEAIEALVDAAETTQAVGAHAEATAQLDHALELLDGVDDVDLRTHLEIEVRLLRGSGAAAQLGYAAPAAIVDFEACRALIAATDPEGYLDDDLEAGDKSLIGRMWSTAGFWATLILRGRLDEAEEVSRGLMRQLRPDGMHHHYIDNNRGLIDHFRGDYASAAPRIARTIALLDHLDPPRRLSVPSDLVAVPRSHLAIVLATQCDLAGAHTQLELAIEHTEQLPFPQRPFSRCYAEAMNGAMQFAARGTASAIAESAVTLRELGERHGFPFWLLLGGLLQALVEVSDGDEDAGPRAEASMAVLRSMDVLVWQPSWLATLADGHLRHGRPEDAARLLAESAHWADQTQAHYWDAETARLRHGAEVALGNPPDVAALRAAADLALEQGATLFEIRSRVDALRLTDDVVDRTALAAAVARADFDVVPNDVMDAREMLASSP